MNTYNLENLGKEKGMGLYIHIPFCISKCRYCDFSSYTYWDDSLVRDYFVALKREIEGLVAWLGEEALFDTVFIGGGTPSLVDSGFICEILRSVPLANLAEVSLEGNPGSLTSEKAEAYEDSGINRISLGVQSFDDRELRLFGRVHTGAEALDAVELVRKAGIDNINVDLIFGFPGQSMETWKATVNKVMEIKPEHISFYSLQIEEGTPLYKDFQNGKLNQLSEDEDREMYHYILNQIKMAGYNHYEISNGAIPGYECRHNLKYWNMCNYIGVGAAAHSFINNCRFSNVDTIKGYIDSINGSLKNGLVDYKKLHEMDSQSIYELMSDYIFTGLRTSNGINLKWFENICNVNFYKLHEDFLNDCISNNLMEINNDYLCFTYKGLDISNYLISQLM